MSIVLSNCSELHFIVLIFQLNLLPLPIWIFTSVHLIIFGSPLSYCTLIFDHMRNLYTLNAYKTLFYFISKKFCRSRQLPCNDISR